MLEHLQQRTPFLWVNPRLSLAATVLRKLRVQFEDLRAAEEICTRWAAPLRELFPELSASNGIIESPLLELVSPIGVLRHPIPGRVWLKQDHALPVAGSIKARGGVFDVLRFADTLLRDAGLIKDVSPIFIGKAARDLLKQHTVSVGSTGNLGLSIGVMGSALGLQCTVHMSRDAKEWKKTRLIKRGVRVIEHEGDFAAAVAAGRAAASDSKNHYFIDDENSEQLFLGYAVAAFRLKEQLTRENIVVDEKNPLFVYLPCGVGGAPGGITFGLKHVFGDCVHCFFAEPCASPAMLLRLAFPDKRLSAYDIGLDNVTEADGLAVAKASELAASLVENLVSGVFTVSDHQLFSYLYRLHLLTGIAIEPSAAAGFSGPIWLTLSSIGHDYLDQHSLTRHLVRSTHLVWTTGGCLMPVEEQEKFLARGRSVDHS